MAPEARAGEGLKRRNPGVQARASGVNHLEVIHVSKASTAQAAGQEQRRFLDTPEAAFALVGDIDPICLDELLNCMLLRSGALVTMLMGSIHDRDGITYNPSTITNLLWLLQGQIDQMQVVVAKLGAE